MPLYEYLCQQHGKFAELVPMSKSDEDNVCPYCKRVAKRIMSLTNWKMGWKFLKGKSERSPAAPTGSGYYPEWDQAYGP